MAMPLTNRNLAICTECVDCITGKYCRYSKRKIKFKPAKDSSSIYFKEWYQINRAVLKSKRDAPFEKMKQKAHHAIKKAVSRGLINPPSKCQICNTRTTVVAHHPNYNRRYAVIWCCESCHRYIHQRHLDCKNIDDVKLIMQKIRKGIV